MFRGTRDDEMVAKDVEFYPLPLVLTKLLFSVSFQVESTHLVVNIKD